MNSKTLTSIAAIAAVTLLIAGTVVFPLAAQAPKFRVLYSFKGVPDGNHPAAGLVPDATGNLFGTTELGGMSNKGTVFEIETTGRETVLHSFTGMPDGESPYAGLVRDAAGNLYGTTSGGGAYALGTVFKVDTTGQESILHSFAGFPTDGKKPIAGLLRGTAGNLYGTTDLGGAFKLGTVFKVNVAGAETVLYSFTGAPDGANPYSGVIQDEAGNLYGTTYHGGSARYGTVFKLNSDGTDSVLFNFTGYGTGAYPEGGLALDTTGNLYGTTESGGGGSCFSGVVFELDTAGAETVLHVFTGGADGDAPLDALARDLADNLYGATVYGGSGSCSAGHGLVYKVNTAGKETVLHTFMGTPDGEYPQGNVIRDAAGNLYGTTTLGGSASVGTVFKLTP